MLEKETVDDLPVAVAKLNQQIEALNRQLKPFQQEKVDLKILLETPTERSNVIESELQSQVSFEEES